MSSLKSRRFLAYPVSGMRRTSAFAPWKPYYSAGPETFEIVGSESNGRLRDGTWDFGADFSVKRERHEYVPHPLVTGNSNHSGQVRIEGPTTSWTDLPMPSQPSDIQAFALGGTAIARTRPDSPIFDLANTIGEIRADGIPHAPGTSVMEQTRLAQKAGDEYLNVQFGWVPLVSSINDFSYAVEHSDEIVRDYQEGANRWHRVEYHWPEETATKSDSYSFSMQPPIGFFQGGGRSQRTSKKMWFVGSWYYYLPLGGSMTDKLRRHAAFARKLYGTSLTPETLWQLAPWSWAADWVTNTGDVIGNLSSIGLNGQVLRYGYLMCHTLRETTDYGVYQGRTMRHTILEEEKRRWVAHPFGFGLSYEGLTLQQKAIIAALGLSRW